MKATFVALVAVVTVSFALGAEPTTHPKTILVIRHAEKPTDDKDIHLSPEGQKRARALPDLFVKSATRPNPFPTPDFIFAAKASKHSNRSVETVTPLAKALKLEINSRYADEEFPKLVELLDSDKKYSGKTVLICWRHGMIPALAGKLGVNDGPDKFKGSVFDQAWVVTFDEMGKPKLAIREQALMPSDAK